MKTFKFFDQPRYHDAEFYKDRPVSDHIHEPGHRQRLLKTVSDIQFLCDFDAEIKSVTDLGCGNGGMLWELKKRKPEFKLKGYDLSPRAVKFAQENYQIDSELLDFAQEIEKAECGDVVVLTETLEHLVDPEGLLKKLRGRSRWVVASVPALENDTKHYEFHLWAWEPPSFQRMFRLLGYDPLMHYAVNVFSTQFLIARNPCV